MKTIPLITLLLAAALAAQELTVNKKQFAATQTFPANFSTFDSTPDIGSAGIGVPFQYVIEVGSSGANGVQVNETLPAGFVLVGLPQCHATGSAVCPLTLSVSGSAPNITVGNFSIPDSASKIYLVLRGYFKSGGTTLTNIVNATPHAGANASNKDQITIGVPLGKVPVNLDVTKSVDKATAALGDTVHYTITVKNLSTTEDVYLGQLLTLRDRITSAGISQLAYSRTTPVCTPSAGTVDCPADVIGSATGTLGQFTQALVAFKYTAQTPGFLPHLESFTLEFDVTFTASLGCKSGTAAVQVKNQARLDLAGGIIDADGVLESDTVITTLTDRLPILPICVSTPGVSLTKEQIDPVPTADVDWNTTVTYRITINNPTATSLIAAKVTDSLWSGLGTPPFTATFESLTCSSNNCGTSFTEPTVNPLSVTVQQTWTAFFAATVDIPANSTVVLVLKVKYQAGCETDTIANRIINGVSLQLDTRTSTGSQAQATKMKNLDLCKVKVTKCVLDPNGTCLPNEGPRLVFGQPVKYRVDFINESVSTLTIGSVADRISIDSNRYGQIPIVYSVACLAAGGTVTPSPATALNRTNLATTVSHQSQPWRGVPLIANPNNPLTFGPNASVTCTVTVTAQAPPGNDSLCQGGPLDSKAGPHLVNAAFLDVSADFAPGDNQPEFYARRDVPLPLCRNVIVDKEKVGLTFGPNQPVPFLVKVTNKGDDPVSGFQLSDPLPPGFANAVVTPCSPATACSAGPAVNVNTGAVEVTLNTLAKDDSATFTITANSPQAGGAYTNVAIGSYVDNSGFFNEGSGDGLIGRANVQVVTPTLKKEFGEGNPQSIAQGGAFVVTFTVLNKPGNPPQTGIGFTDTLPPGLVFVPGSAGGTCKGTLTISPDGSSLTLAGGELTGESCKITVRVIAKGCGLQLNRGAAGPEAPSNYSNVTNLDVSNATDSIQITKCKPMLQIKKVVAGAPVGYRGIFTFLVNCMTPNGVTQQTVTITLPTTSVTLDNLPAGSSCIVAEDTSHLPAPPQGFVWSGTPALSPNGGAIVIGTNESNLVTVTNTLKPCDDKGEVTVEKKLLNVPPDFRGSFQLTLTCLANGQVRTYPITLRYPGLLSTVVTGLAPGSICTVTESNTLPTLPAGYYWQPPVYQPGFGTVALTGTCCQTVTVTNSAKYCCTVPGGSGYQRTGPSAELYKPKEKAQPAKK